MTDVSHELGALRFVVDSPLSSKVAMFNNHVQQHKNSQHLNPFSGSDGRASPKPTFAKDEYGKPLAGSMTEMRGQKANMHVMREMLELCQIINTEGYPVKDEPSMRVIPFGELFNIYNYISDKCVGILLRARKHKLVEFEGEMLFQRRDDDVPIFLLKPIAEIKKDLTEKIDAIKRASSPAPPQATSVLLDKSAHNKKLKEAGLVVDVKARSLSPSPAKIKAKVEMPVASAEAPAAIEVRRPSQIHAEALQAALSKLHSAELQNSEAEAAAAETSVEIKIETIPEETKAEDISEEDKTEQAASVSTEQTGIAAEAQQSEAETAATEAVSAIEEAALSTAEPTAENDKSVTVENCADSAATENTNACTNEALADVNNNETASNTAAADSTIEQQVIEHAAATESNADLPTIVIEAAAVYVRNAADQQQPDQEQSKASEEIA